MVNCVVVMVVIVVSDTTYIVVVVCCDSGGSKSNCTKNCQGRPLKTARFQIHEC